MRATQVALIFLAIAKASYDRALYADKHYFKPDSKSFWLYTLSILLEAGAEAIIKSEEEFDNDSKRYSSNNSQAS